MNNTDSDRDFKRKKTDRGMSTAPAKASNLPTINVKINEIKSLSKNTLPGFENGADIRKGSVERNAHGLVEGPGPEDVNKNKSSKLDAGIDEDNRRSLRGFIQ